ncbi:unnamed protein product [Blepharisma stoltei]|uniref:CSC1/OSCA1-like N-terminal transmembrane domain-containing protein n=1 Tax=Blepharisma stoltei TaxID=1481888 RepID=A0AAU9K4J8_9CILI|nr:unnamed protein product [Blepharisma stoltei]
MDQGFYQILYTLGIDTIIFSILFLLFLLSHNYRTKHTTTYKAEDAQPKNAIYSESETPVWKLLKIVWRTGLMDIHEKCGLLAYIYLSLLWQIIIFLSIVCILGIPSLVPIYFSGNGLPDESTNKEGIANILDDEYLMIAPILYYIFFSFLAYWLVYIILRTISYRTTINVGFN